MYQARVVFMFGAVRCPMSPGTPHVGAATCHYGNANPGGGATAGAGCRALHYSSRFGCRKETYMPRARAPEEWLCASHAGGSLWGGCLRRSGSGIAPRHHGVGHAGNRRRAEVVGRIKYTVRSRRHLLTPCPKEGRGCNSALGSLLPGVRERYRGGGSAPRQHSTPSSPLLD